MNKNHQLVTNDSNTSQKQRTERKQQLPKPVVIAKELKALYQDELAWNIKTNLWYVYKGNLGIWLTENDKLVQLKVQEYLDKDESTANNYNISYVNGIIRLLQSYLLTEEWSNSGEFLPLQNGVLNLKTKELQPHSPKLNLTWRLPYAYDLSATCEPIKAWMLEAMSGDQQVVELLRAYLNAIVKGRTDLQRYLECVGAGGTGKSTLTRLAVALIGKENVFTTSLNQLETNRFETSGIYGKRLILINDSEQYTGDVSTLKAIVGQDPIRYERKFVQQSAPFVAQAMVLIAANQTIQSKDHTSGLQRRRLTVPFVHQVTPEKRRDLLTLNHDGISGELAPYISGLLNWVLELSDEQVTELVRNTDRSVPSLTVIQSNILCETNPLADWLDQRVIFSQDAKNYVGTAKQEPSKYLYPNYILYCQESKNRPVSLKKFSELLIDLCRNQLMEASIKKGKDRNGAHLIGLRLREEVDMEPSPVTDQVFAHKTVICFDGKVKAETAGSDECDDCDGLIQGSQQIDVDTAIGKDSGRMLTSSSHPSQKARTTLNATLQTSQDKSLDKAESSQNYQSTNSLTNQEHLVRAVAQLLKQGSSWEEIEKIVYSLSKAEKEAAWALLTQEEQDKILVLKEQAEKAS